MSCIKSWLVIALCVGVALAQQLYPSSMLGSPNVYDSMLPMHGHRRPDPADDPVPVAVSPKDITGKWFNQVFIPPSSWAGMRRAKNFEIVFTPVSGGYRVFVKWRIEECASHFAMLHSTKIPGVFALEDNIGDVVSGDYAFVAVEGDCFCVIRGCVKRHPVSNRCLDYWVSAKTRDRYPDGRAREKIRRVLLRLGHECFNYLDHSLQHRLATTPDIATSLLENMAAGCPRDSHVDARVTISNTSTYKKQ